MEPMKPMKPMKPMAPMKPMKFENGHRWWPAALGEPSSSGSQNDLDYAYFRQARRLLIREGGEVTTYDTKDHDIHGVSQGRDAAHATFTSNHGVVDLSELERV